MFPLVRGERLELSRHFWQQILSLPCLPLVVSTLRKQPQQLIEDLDALLSLRAGILFLDLLEISPHVPEEGNVLLNRSAANEYVHHLGDTTELFSRFFFGH